jgi:hypothetical protein
MKKKKKKKKKLRKKTANAEYKCRREEGFLTHTETHLRPCDTFKLKSRALPRTPDPRSMWSISILSQGQALKWGHDNQKDENRVLGVGAKPRD